MNSFLRPLLLGYIRWDILRDGSDLPWVEAQLEDFAHSEKYSLGTIYVERGSPPGAFDALMTEAIRDETTWGIVIPDLRHLTEDEHAVLRAHNGGAHTPILVANSRRPGSAPPRAVRRVGRRLGS